MLPSHAIELAAAAAAAMQRLDEYEFAVRQVLRNPDDAFLYRRNADQFDAIRALTASLPGVRVSWVEVLISRFELLEELTRVSEGKPPDRLEHLVAVHTASLQSYRRRCLRQMTGLLVQPKASAR